MPVSEPAVTTDAAPLPTVSILIAARNEEADIIACLRALTRLDYPANAVEVLIGNDSSVDQTGPLVTAFIADKPGFRLVSITESTAGLRGKANVLAQLARLARGEWLFFTDADTQVPTGWIGGMLTLHHHKLTAGAGVVTGVTLPFGPRLFHKMQTIDWLYNLTLTHWLSAFGLPVTAMGNNMAVRRTAYDVVGGYENLPFSVTEDYALFRAIISRGYGFRNRLDEQVMATTRPVDTVHDWLEQRKRWMRGASELPVWMVALLYIQYLIGPVLLLLAWIAPVLAVGLYIGRLFVQTTVLSFGMARLRRTTLWPYALLFEPYQLLLGPLAVAYYRLSGPVRWKGRQFD